MKTTAKKTSRISKKQYILIATTSVVVVLLGWWAYVNFMPHPLGDKLEYLGKEDLGGGLFFRDYAPYSNYYYATDMTPEEVARYFKGATVEHPIEQDNGFTEIWLKHDSYNQTAKLYYYETIELTQTGIKNSSGKKHAIGIRSENYELLMRSL